MGVLSNRLLSLPGLMTEVLAACRSTPLSAGARALLLGSVVFGIAACGGDSPTEALPAPEGTLYFVSDRAGGEGGGEYAIYRLSPEAAEPVRLTETIAGYWNLSLSPDGSTLLFESDRAGCSDIFVMDTAASGVDAVTGPDDSCEWGARWSPDGAMIAYATAPTLGDRFAIMVVDLAERSPLNLSDGGAEPLAPPFWSPGGLVVFQAALARKSRLHQILPDGSGLTPAAGFTAEDHSPFWSPEGGRVAFERRPFTGPGDILVRSIGGQEVIPLSVDPADDRFPLDYRSGAVSDPWSPDGERVALVRGPVGGEDILVAEADGSELRNVTDHPGSDIFFTWIDDNRILFTSDRTGNRDIYVMDADGSNLVNLTDDPADDGWPVWVPED